MFYFNCVIDVFVGCFFFTMSWLGLWSMIVEFPVHTHLPLDPGQTRRFVRIYWLIIDNSHFEQMVGQIYSTELQLNKANSLDTESPFWTWTCP